MLSDCKYLVSNVYFAKSFQNIKPVLLKFLRLYGEKISDSARKNVLRCTKSAYKDIAL